MDEPITDILHSSLPSDAHPAGDAETYVLRLLDECRQEVQMSDSKTAMLFAAVATVIAFFANSLIDPTSAIRTNGNAVLLVSLASLTTWFVALALLALAVTPRLGRPTPGKARYFLEHAQYADHGELLELLKADARHSIERHTQQLHVLSRIVRRKYTYLRAALETICAAVMLVAAASVIGAAT